MSLRMRPASTEDLTAIVGLTAANRQRLATWAPRWWAPSAAADEVHPLWLDHLVSNRPGTFHVAVAGDDVVGCAAAMAQEGQWFLDDVAVGHDDLWPEMAGAVARHLPGRPALTCIAEPDTARARAFEAAGAHLVSTYWIRPTDGATTPVGPVGPVDDDARRRRPPHTFGGSPFDPAAPDALAFTTPAGTVVGSSPVAAPPVYDPGGTVTVIDHIDGEDLDALLSTALGISADRGDVLLNVVCAPDDAPLIEALRRGAFAPTVRVHRLD